MIHRARSNRSLLATPRKFTLIELLVVVVIISVLAAMLLPALSRARFQATKISCLSDRRQNFMSLQYFANDYDGLVPHPVGDVNWRYSDARNDYYEWRGLNRYGSDDERDRMIPYHRGVNEYHGWSVNRPNAIYNSNTGGGTTQLASIGVMAAFGYITDPAMLYCPAFKRPEEHITGHNENYYVDKHPRVWEALTDGDGAVPRHRGEEGGMAAPMRAGIVHYFRDDHNYSRLSDYARLWRDNDKVSPMMFSCAQDNGGPEPFRHNPWGQLRLCRERISHGAQGVNGVFVDGSARWVTEEELTSSYAFDYPNPRWYWFGDPDYLTNNSYYRAFQRWVRSSKFTGIAPPN